MNIRLEGDEVIISKTDFSKLIGDTPIIEPIVANTMQPAEGESREIVITKHLEGLGFRHNLLGFNYLREAISICVIDPNAIHKMMSLYASVAFVYDTTESRVERAMRHAIETAGVNQTVSEFIAATADQIRLGR